jgi:hypothetical protein
METVRVKICFRPLRVCWAIGAGDRAAFRKAVMLSNTFWGGRFNPIVIADRVEEADRIALAFRADVIVPVGDSETVKRFPERYPHLINPFFHKGLFVGSDDRDTRAQMLDVHNTFVHRHDSPEWKAAREKGFRLYQWDDGDALSDALLVQLGRYPEHAETRVDYREIMKRASEAVEVRISQTDVVPKELLDHPGVSYVSRLGMQRHYGIRSKAVVRRILNLCARLWRDDSDRPWLDTSPLIQLEGHPNKREPYPLSIDEERLLFSELDGHLATMAIFKVNTGLREQEVVKLRWSWEVMVPELKTSVFVVPKKTL